MEIISVKLPNETEQLNPSILTAPEAPAAEGPHAQDPPAEEKSASPAPRAEERPAGKKKRSPGPAIPALALCFTVLLGCISLFAPKKAVSDTENRVLAERPAFSVSALWDGTLQSAWETYFTDHFAFRDAWLRLNGRLRTALGIKETDGVYTGKENRLFLIPAAPDETDVKKKADAINAFAKENPDITCAAAIAPNAISVQSAYLPKGAAAPDQKAQIEAFYGLLKNVKTADLYTPLAAHADEYIYYRTDHHWTSLGARYALEGLAAALEIPCEGAAYERIPAAEGFYGTLASKTGLFRAADTVELFVPKTDVEYYVLDPATGEKTGSLYREAFLTAKDKYAVFFGGNAPLTVLRTTADTGRHLAVFKDSYANAMMQFIYPFFDEIVLIDPRYFYEDLGPVLRQYAVTDALFLYNADTFWGDVNLADLL